MEKSLEERIFETREIIRQVIAESKLNVSIAEMILHEIYIEVKGLSEENVRQKILERQQAEIKAEEESRAKEEIQNGGE